MLVHNLWKIINSVNTPTHLPRLLQGVYGQFFPAFMYYNTTRRMHCIIWGEPSRAYSSSVIAVTTSYLFELLLQFVRSNCMFQAQAKQNRAGNKAVYSVL